MHRSAKPLSLACERATSRTRCGRSLLAAAAALSACTPAIAQRVTLDIEATVLHHAGAAAATAAAGIPVAAGDRVRGRVTLDTDPENAVDRRVGANFQQTKQRSATASFVVGGQEFGNVPGDDLSVLVGVGLGAADTPYDLTDLVEIGARFSELPSTSNGLSLASVDWELGFVVPRTFGSPDGGFSDEDGVFSTGGPLETTAVVPTEQSVYDAFLRVPDEPGLPGSFATFVFILADGRRSFVTSRINSATVVPEPAGIAALAAAGGCLVAPRRRAGRR